MTEILADKTVISDDIAAGEIVVVPNDICSAKGQEVLMTQAGYKQTQPQIDFEQCRDKYREATGDMLMALLENGTEEQAKAFYESLTLINEPIEAINDRIKAAKREQRLNEIARRTPKEGDEVLVDVCPCGAETWMQIGKVLYAWNDDECAENAVWALIELTRALTQDENDGYWSDGSWNGCRFVCRLSYWADDWRAYWPANDRAREEWVCTDD